MNIPVKVYVSRPYDDNYSGDWYICDDGAELIETDSDTLARWTGVIAAYNVVQEEIAKAVDERWDFSK